MVATIINIVFIAVFTSVTIRTVATADIVVVVTIDNSTSNINSTTIVLQHLPAPARVNGRNQFISIVLTMTSVGPLAPSTNMVTIADPR